MPGVPASDTSATDVPARSWSRSGAIRARSLCAWRLTSRGEAPRCSSRCRVRRVSSAATIGTSRRMRAARSVRSSRLPIGVDTTYRVPPPAARRSLDRSRATSPLRRARRWADPTAVDAWGRASAAPRGAAVSGCSGGAMLERSRVWHPLTRGPRGRPGRQTGEAAPTGVWRPGGVGWDAVAPGERLSATRRCVRTTLPWSLSPRTAARPARLPRGGLAPQGEPRSGRTHLEASAPGCPG